MTAAGQAINSLCPYPCNSLFDLVPDAQSSIIWKIVLPTSSMVRCVALGPTGQPCRGSVRTQVGQAIPHTICRRTRAMQQNDIQATVTRILEQVAKVDPAAVARDTRLREDLGVDSLTLI